MSGASTLCICGHSEVAHPAGDGCCCCDACRSFVPEDEVIFTQEDKQEWTKIIKRVGLRKRKVQP